MQSTRLALTVALPGRMTPLSIIRGKGFLIGRRFSFDESEDDSPTHLKKRKKAAESFTLNLRVGNPLGKSSFKSKVFEEAKEVREEVKLSNDVRLGISPDSKPIQIKVLEEVHEEVASAAKNPDAKKELSKAAKGIKEDLVEKVELDHFDVIPISSSSQFHKVSSSEAYHDFMDSLNVMTEVIGSDNKALIGTKRSILNQKHLGTIGFLLNPENEEE